MHPGVIFTREVELGAADAADERVPVVISTEHPVERDGFVEVLSHEAEQHVDLSRAPLPLLTLHDHRRLPVGVVEDVRVDTATRVLRGFVRFGTTPEAQELMRQVREKTLRWLSIGYTLLREVGRAGRVVRYAFQPHEASLVAVPADPGAQFFRSQHPRIQMSDQQQGTGTAGRNIEADRVKEIVALGAQYAKYLHPNDLTDACARGMDVAAFREMVMARMETRHTDISVAHVGMSRPEVARYSLARAIAASITGDWSKAGLEREASRSAERSFGVAPEGFFVPSDVWARRDFNVGTGSEAGNLVATDLRGDLFVDALRAAIALGPLGLKVLPGLASNVDIPRKATASTLAMLTEIGSASETAPATGKVSLTPKRIGAYIEYSKQALIQSALALEPMLRDDLLQGAAGLIEYQMINGAGTGAEMRGVRNTSGIGTHVMGSNGASVDWPAVVALESATANANAIAGALSGYVANTKTRAKLKTVPKSTGLDFAWSDQPIGTDGFARLNGYRVAITNHVPGNLTKGTSTTICSSSLFGSDWSMAVLALFGAPDIVVDPYTLAATGQVRITINQFADFGVRQPAAFAKVDDLLT